jgi:uncharacterized OsmC-like protein
MSAKTAAKTTIRNGVKVDDLLEAIEAVTADAENGSLTFRTSSRWLGGFRARHTPGIYRVGTEEVARSTDYSIVSDEPTEILGTDHGISPAELVLSALAACLIVGYAANAAALGINLQDIAVEISAGGSLEGFMNIRNAKPGLESITVEATLTTDAPAESVAELHEYVNAHSPVWDTLARPLRVSSNLVIKSV